MGALVVVALGLAALGTVAALIRLTSDDGLPHPDEWDERVLPLVEFVEEARDLEFDHPVYVDFLTPDEYRTETTTDEADLTDEDIEDLDIGAGELRALGMASGEIDLLSAYNDVSDSGTLAYYDPAEARVTVRGTEMSVGLAVTLVHELTHALQDQHFDLNRLYDEDMDSGAAFALRALIEGDATRIEDDYVEDLSEADRETYDSDFESTLEESVAATADVPTFIRASFAVPYALGPPFVAMLENEGGNDAVDDAFRDPPDSEDDLFDPASYLADEDEDEVGVGLADDIDVIDEDTFGSPAWFLVLAERIDPKVAFEAALGWGGDAYASFRRDGAVCARAVFRGDTDDDESEMAAAIEEWLAALPGEAAEAITVDGHPGFEACDPGEDVDMELSDRSEKALNLPALWGYLVADAASVVDADAARCYARAVMKDLTFEQMIDPEGAAFSTDEFGDAVQTAFESCL